MIWSCFIEEKTKIMLNDLIMFIEEKNENNVKWSDHVLLKRKTKIMLNDLIMFIEEKNENNVKWSDHIYRREKRK